MTASEILAKLYQTRRHVCNPGCTAVVRVQRCIRLQTASQACVNFSHNPAPCICSMSCIPVACQLVNHRRCTVQDLILDSDTCYSKRHTDANISWCVPLGVASVKCSRMKSRAACKGQLATLQQDAGSSPTACCCHAVGMPASCGPGWTRQARPRPCCRAAWRLCRSTASLRTPQLWSRP